MIFGVLYIVMYCYLVEICVLEKIMGFVKLFLVKIISYLVKR